MKRRNNAGFTLVELSIVLVIIGLLIGGLLVAQSMIGTTKIQSFVRQIGQFDAAVGTFREKFNALPGDNTIFGSTQVSVNGVIEGSSGVITVYEGEIGRFWYDLGQAGLKNEGGAAYADNSADASTPTAGTDNPKSPVGTLSSVIAYGASGANYYWVGKIAVNNTITSAVQIKPAEALAIDTKMDDGLPSNTDGNVVASVATTLALADDTDCQVTGTAHASGVTDTYDAANTNDACSLRIRIGSVTGNLQ